MKPSSGSKVLDLSLFRAKKADKCLFCNCLDNLYFFRKQIVCLECLRNIQKLYIQSR